MGPQAGVRGPQAGERLAHGANVCLWRTCAYWSAAKGELPGADPPGEDLKNWNFVRDGDEPRVHVDGCAEFKPDLPCFSVALGSPSHDSGFDLVLDSAKVSAEAVAVGKWQGRQHRV